MKPLALFIYKRTKTVQRVLESIPIGMFEKLYVIADGPKNKTEKSQCDAAKSLVENFALENNIILFTNYSDKNLGGPRRIPTGLNWVFDHEDEAIILEDDCVPSNSFYKFCCELLDKYKSDDRIGAISGNNFQNLQATNFSYYYSVFNHCWGWATWKRAWKHFDISLSTFPEFLRNGGLNSIFTSKKDVDYWSNIFYNLHRCNKIHWDYAWTYSCWAQNYLSILPEKNLVTNIGFGIDASNTFDEFSPFSHLKSHDIKFPLSHPDIFIRNKYADDYTQKIVFSQPSLIRKIFIKLQNISRGFASKKQIIH